MAKTYQSKKAKGKRLELKVAQIIRQQLGIKAVRMPLSGAAGGELSGDIFCQELPFYFELKNQEKPHLWKWWQGIRDKKNPVLIISGNNRPILAVCDLEMFLWLVKSLLVVKNLK